MTALDDVPKMTVAKLRDALQAKGLDTTGLKAALVARLQEALQSGGADVPAPSPKPSPGRASKRKRDSTSEPPAPAPEPAPPAPALEPAPEPPLPAEPAPPPAKATPTVAPVAPSPASENREAAPVSAMDARAAAIAALTADLKDEPDEDPADDAAQTTVRPSKTTQTTTACPYLDTVNRSLLDFDFEKCCSVSLSPHNVYACLVCGKYFQGRGVTTPAYTHALEHGHHVFLRLADGKSFCLPDSYEIKNDASLEDVRSVLDPRFTLADACATNSTKQWRHGLDGKEFLTGTVGLNNLAESDYANCVLQCLTRVFPLRAFFLTREEKHEQHAKRVSTLTLRFGELIRKMWNPKAFKGQVSPHELMRAVASSSGGKFKVASRSDPVDFFQWLLHALGRETKAKGTQSIVDKCFSGAMEVRTVGEPPAGDGVGTSETAETEGVTTQTVPFKMLALDLPPPPLFQDSMEKNIIPQVSIVELLKKYDGVSTTATPRGGLRTHRLTQLPEYLIVHYKRFTKNAFFREKNNTIVTFPTKTPLRLAEHVPCPVDAKTGAQQNSTYVLVANVCHDGPPDGGTFRAQVFHNADSHWYDISDLQVEETLAQQVALTETYVQIWERRAGTGPGLGGARAKKNAHAEEDPFGLGDLGGDDMVE